VQKFNAPLVERILWEEANKRVGNMEYRVSEAPQVRTKRGFVVQTERTNEALVLFELQQAAKELADVIKERIRMEQFARYKIIVEVTVGQKLGQCMRIASRGLWDASTDKCALLMPLCSLFRRSQTSFSLASTAMCTAGRRPTWRMTPSFVSL